MHALDLTHKQPVCTILMILPSTCYTQQGDSSPCGPNVKFSKVSFKTWKICLKKGAGTLFHFFHVLVSNIIIVGIGVAVARFYPNIGGIIRYSGATCGLAFVFVYPSIIYIISLHRENQLTWFALLSHFFIILLGMANLMAQFLI